MCVIISYLASYFKWVLVTLTKLKITSVVDQRLSPVKLQTVLIDLYPIWKLILWGQSQNNIGFLFFCFSCSIPPKVKYMCIYQT